MKTSFTYELDAAAQEKFAAVVAAGNFRERKVPYSRLAVEGDGFNATLYEKEKRGRRKLCVQGAKAEDFVRFTLEGQVLEEATLDYKEILHPELSSPHAGSDESGKGDYFGPLVVTCVYADETLAPKLREAGAKDCKLLSAATTLKTGEALRGILGPENFETVVVSPQAYNRMYAKTRNQNKMLARVHAMALERLLAKRPDCPRAVIDQFAATERTILAALYPKAAKIEIVQRHKAEDDVAVAAASVVARETFIREVERLGRLDGAVYPLGASNPEIAAVAVRMVRANGPVWLMNRCKANFKTTDAVLAACGLDRSALPQEGRVASKNS